MKFEGMSLLLSTKGGGIDVGFLGESCHKFNLIASESLLSNEGVVPLL